jgi:hypothetical protein
VFSLQALAGDLVTSWDAPYCETSPDPVAQASANADPDSLPDDGSVWQVGSRRWTDEWEQAYSRWIGDRTQLDGRLLLDHGLDASCGLYAVYVRAIFARMHSLPFVFFWDNGKKSTGHFSKEFQGPRLSWNEKNWRQRLDEDARFRMFLHSLIGKVLSYALPENLYPIRVFSDDTQSHLSKYVRGGTLITSKSHTKFVTRVDPSRWQPIRAQSATTPTQAQFVPEVSYLFSGPNDNWMRLWRWPVFCGKSWSLVPGEQMDGYSPDEQKDFPQSQGFGRFKKANGWNPLLGNYLESIARKPGMAIPPKDTVPFEMHAVGDYLRVRINIVDRGIEEGRGLSARQKAEGTQFDEDYSTPNYDAQTEGLYRDLENLVKLYGALMGVTLRDFRKWANAEIIEDGSIKTTLYLSMLAKKAGRLSPTPGADLEERWGIPFLRARMAELQTLLPELRQKKKLYQDELNVVLSDMSAYSRAYMQVAVALHPRTGESVADPNLKAQEQGLREALNQDTPELIATQTGLAKTIELLEIAEDDYAILTKLGY